MSWRSSVAAAALAVLAFAAPAAEEKGSGALSLDECLREALGANPGLAAAEARAGAADQAAVAAGAARWPRLDLNAGYALSERAQRLVQPSSAGEAVRYEKDLGEVALDARVALWAGGRLAARERAARLGAEMGREAVSLSRQDLALAVAATYLAAVEQRSSIEALGASLEALEAQLTLARTLEEVGRIPPLDRLKVEVRAASVRQQLSRARTDREVELERLSALLGRPRGESRAEVAGPPPELARPQNPGDLETAALSARPEAGVARLDMERARAELAAVRGERLPSLDAFARYTYRTAVPSEGGVPPGRYDWASGGLGLRLPLFTGGELKARVAGARLRVAEAEARAKVVELQVVGEVRATVAAEAEAVQRREVARSALGQAREAFEIEKASYELGRGAVNDVLDAQAALLDAELAVARAGRDVALAGVVRARATGEDLVKALSGRETTR